MARSFCLLILGLSSPLWCSELFWFSYKAVTLNNKIIAEEKNIAPAMVPFEGKQYPLCQVPLHKSDEIPTVQFLNKHFEAILPCFYSLSTRMLSHNEQSEKFTNDRVEVVIGPVRFTVDFKDEFATINAVR